MQLGINFQKSSPMLGVIQVLQLHLAKFCFPPSYRHLSYLTVSEEDVWSDVTPPPCPLLLRGGRLLQISLSGHCFPGGRATETLGHVVLYCSFYADAQQELPPFLIKLPGHFNSIYLQLLLSEQSGYILLNIANDCSIICMICLCYNL